MQEVLLILVLLVYLKKGVIFLKPKLSKYQCKKIYCSGSPYHAYDNYTDFQKILLNLVKRESFLYVKMYKIFNRMLNFRRFFHRYGRIHNDTLGDSLSIRLDKERVRIGLLPLWYTRKWYHLFD